MLDKWDSRWLTVAKLFASFSKDPSTGVGACAVDERKVLVSTGYNGLSRGVEDRPDRLLNRETRLRMTAHAEINLLVQADRSLYGCTVYVWPLPPCSQCAAALIQAGVARVVAPAPSSQLAERWGESLELAIMAMREAGVQVDIVDMEEV